MSQLNKITYANKSNPVSVTDRETQATAEDFNEIKSKTNAAIDGVNQIKSNGEALVSGANIISFLAPYPDGVPFYVTVLSCINEQGYLMSATISNKTKNGFTVTVGSAGTLVYLAVPQR